jgi:DNA-binding response OmpR family regulator
MGSDVQVVIAEDERDIQDLIRHTLESADYVVEAYTAGDDCWERLQEGEVPDLVLLDIMLPGMDGLEVLERIRNDDRLADVSVVFLTGRRREDDVVAGFEAEVDDYITKPFSPKELRARLERLV